MATAAAVGAGIVILLKGADSSPVGGPIEAARFSAVAQAAGVAFLFDDGTEQTLSSLPSSILLRRFLRLAVALPVLVAGWAVTLAVAGRRLPFGGHVPAGDLSLEFAVLSFTALALASLASRLLPEREGGVAAAPAVLVVAVCLVILPRRFALFATNPGPAWAAAHRRWWVLLALALLTIVAAGRDPWRRRLTALPGRRRRTVAPVTVS